MHTPFHRTSTQRDLPPLAIVKSSRSRGTNFGAEGHQFPVQISTGKVLSPTSQTVKVTREDVGLVSVAGVANAIASLISMTRCATSVRVLPLPV
jgi:hypothetical protein